MAECRDPYVPSYIQEHLQRRRAEERISVVEVLSTVTAANWRKSVAKTVVETEWRKSFSCIVAFFSHIYEHHTGRFDATPEEDRLFVLWTRGELKMRFTFCYVALFMRTEGMNFSVTYSIKNWRCASGRKLFLQQILFAKLGREGKI